MINKDKAKEITKFFVDPVIENRQNKKIKRNSYYLQCIRNNKIKKNSILLESYHGVNFTGNAYALFRKIIESYPKFKCYIAIKDTKDPMINWIKTYYKGKNFVVVEYESKEYIKLLATCKYLINDTSFMPYFTKRDEQVYLNTWHGTPLKTLGTDIKNSKFNEHKNIQKNLFSSDKLSMPNEFTAQKLIKSHDLDGILNAEVAILGNARVDLTLNSNAEEIIQKYSLKKNKKIVLYAPTWKKSEQETSDQDIQDLVNQTQVIQNTLGDEYHVYLKSHYFIYKKLVDLSYKDYLIPNWVDSNELLSTVDILITDYSSIFFDYLPLKKPIYFFMPDKDEYEEERGLYLELQSLPGHVSFSLDELVDALKIPTNKYLKNYSKEIEDYIEKFCSHDNGISSPLTIDFLFNKKRAKRLFKSQKKVVMFYGGGFYNNGITNSIINLSKKFNYDKYEFVLVENNKLFKEKTDNLNRLDKRAHIITKFSYTNRNIFDTISQNILYRQGYSSKYLNKEYLRKYFELDYKRVFGNLHPDVMIDYGGYNKQFTALFAFAPVKTKCVFLHNDMIEEFNKKINGRYKHKWNLKVIFSLYDEFDKVISVTESANIANKKGLKHIISNANEKMISISNIIDGDKIKQMALEAQDEKNHLILNDGTQDLNYLLYDIEENSSFKVNMKGVQAPNPNDYNFVNVARLSPEKNQESLIKAFKAVVNKYNNSKLYILGDGPLYNHLQRVIKQLKLENNVFLLGHIKNPFMFVSECDCFVLTSNYEGQGMVILEAQILGKPVIGTNVSGINSVLNEQNGLLIENNLQSISKGLLEYINGNIPIAHFDYESYNNEIIEKFESEILDL
ncbi:teichoic acid biosynthesis protein [Staphylococcus felis]|uniref:Teichoic acid biosynthesis protein n=2 Tax=Staphylococcus felis TaxID=46127 RepID=A0AAX1RZR5_9STAP|nr:glycosyltransferase [Staphylococcus felis]REH75524.1 teichoic acid biosynthesis protein [Staphylococcus felis]REH86051.1 teichoic acid biosynthesis protein [Staphylococcus felis]REH86056.1 teichoic acid biosynthesis protein [Staphylococcus felis]REH91344.1 teichoic acid biosynthesis protein [Staphylococcus felis]REI14849.1 teichoic acid biosynthesis protein [Staphylococcus felis]